VNMLYMDCFVTLVFFVCVCLFSSEPVEEAAQALSDSDQTPDKNKKKNRCFSCRKKVGLTGKYQVLTESRFTSGVTTSCHSESDHRNSWGVLGIFAASYLSLNLLFSHISST